MVVLSPGRCQQSILLVYWVQCSQLYVYIISGDHCNQWYTYFAATCRKKKPLQLWEMQVLNFQQCYTKLGLWKECNEPECTKSSKWNTWPVARFSFLFTLGTRNTCYFVLVMTLSVMSIRARLEVRTSSSSLSGRASIALIARLACSRASSFVLSIPRLFWR